MNWPMGDEQSPKRLIVSLTREEVVQVSLGNSPLSLVSGTNNNSNICLASKNPLAVRQGP